MSQTYVLSYLFDLYSPCVRYITYDRIPIYKSKNVILTGINPVITHSAVNLPCYIVITQEFFLELIPVNYKH